MTHVIMEGAQAHPLPPPDRRRVHLISVAQGASRQVSVPSGHVDDRFIHVFDEISLPIILGELDTITDFIQYLEAKEALGARVSRVLFVGGGEEDLVALYRAHGNRIPDDKPIIAIGPDHWSTFVKTAPYIDRREADAGSYVWDRIIETLAAAKQVPDFPGPTLQDPELLIRTMAKESRFVRRELVRAYLGWMRGATRGARTVMSPSGVAYVFASLPQDMPDEVRRLDLAGRCWVARDALKGCATVVGLAAIHELGDESPLDASYLHTPTWGNPEREMAEQFRTRLGIMREAKAYRSEWWEWPKPSTAPSKSKHE